MSKKVFTSQKISLFLAGREFRVQTLISTYGAKYVFDDGDLPEEARYAFGTEISATYKGIPVRCRFVRETIPAGTIYGLRFLDPSSLLVRTIEKDVEASGIPSPWMRGLPRLATSAKHLPVPVLAVASQGASTFYLNVRNFTLGGLLLEYTGGDFEQFVIGRRLELDLVTNGGDKLAEISGVITHLSVELGPHFEASNRIQFGFKFTHMGPVTEIKYRGLIREHCEGLKQELSPEASAG